MFKALVRNVVSSTLLCISPIFAVSQTYSDFNNKVNIGLISPEAASLGKFGNVPVSYSTGVPDISIPIFQIKIAEITVPVSLNYHAGGIRVDEGSSSVGTGWALNAGGTLSRSTVGLPDESSYGYLTSPDPLLVSANPSNYVNYIYDHGLGIQDCSPDVFQYNFPGGSGKFSFKRSGTAFDQFPITNNVITRYGANLFKITDQNGTQYLFEDTETTNPSDASIQSPAYTSSWKLSKIVSKNLKDTVLFLYDKAASVVQHVRSDSHTIGTQPDCNGQYLQPVNADNVNIQTLFVDESYVKEIRWRGGKITFNNVGGRTDNGQCKRLDEVNVYSKLNGAFSPIKRLKLFHSYFFYQPSNYNLTPSNEQNLYRLRLDKVEFYDVNNVQPPQAYTMTYNNTNMAPRESNAQDKWGFNNGRFTNTSLMPPKTVLYDQLLNGNAAYFSFGDADRECYPTDLKACTMESITYPTGGKSVFEMEPHQFKTDLTQTVTTTVRSESEGSLRSSSLTTFTVTAAMTNFRYNAYISPYNYPNVSNRPEIKMIDQTTSQQVLGINTLDANNGVTVTTSPLNVQLVVGHTYALTTNIYTTNANVRAYINLLYDTQTTSTVNIAGGGLRIRSVTNFDHTGAFISKKSYEYGADGAGELMTPYQYFMLTSESTINRIWCSDFANGILCIHKDGNPSVTYRAGSVVPISQMSGSPVLYGSVTEYDENSSGGKNNGKKVFGYTISVDQQTLANNSFVFSGVQMISNVWRNGYLKLERTYKSDGVGGYTIVEEKEHNYTTTRLANENILRLKRKFSYGPPGCEIRNGSSVFNDFFIDVYQIPYAAILLTSEVTRVYDDAGNPLENSKTIAYDAASHVMPTSTARVDSKGDTFSESIQYPIDFTAPGNVYEQMVGRNIIATPVSITVSKGISPSVQLKKARAFYKDHLNDGKVLLPEKSSSKVLAFDEEDIMNYKYGDYGNILEQSHTFAPSESYLWDYNSIYPVAVAKNATSSDIAFTSFEAEANGNWTIPSSARNMASAITGKRSYLLGGANGSISKPSLTAATTYVVSYWTQNSSPFSIAGTISGYPKKGDSHLGWTYYEHRVTGQTTITISGTGNIDEVRLYPLGAQMETYTYEPLVGTKTKADARSAIQYFEYDGFQRLVKIRDLDGNIIKQMDYHLKSL